MGASLLLATLWWETMSASTGAPSTLWMLMSSLARPWQRLAWSMGQQRPTLMTLSPPRGSAHSVMALVSQIPVPIVAVVAMYVMACAADATLSSRHIRAC